MPKNWQPAMLEATSKLRNNGSEDFTVVCGDREFKVHHYVLCIHSPVLAKMCCGPFKACEAQDRTIDLSAHHSDLVDALIEFCHQATWTSTDGEYHPLELDCAMYILGDAYDIPHLRSATLQEIKEKLAAHKETDESLARAAIVTYEAAEASMPIRKVLAAEIVRCKAWKKNEMLFAGVTDQAAFTSDLSHEMQDKLEEFEVEVDRRRQCPKVRCKYCGTFMVVELQRRGAEFAMRDWRCPDWYCDCESNGEMAMELLQDS